MQISLIMPALNEAATIVSTLQQLQPMRQQGHQIILVDGGSSDDTVKLAQPLVDKVVNAPRGRARQMNAGAEKSDGDVLWFLHSDTIAPPDAEPLILNALSDNKNQWGHFRVRLSGRQFIFRVIAFMMNLRSCLSGIATGDQGIFVRREVFEKMAGFTPIALMEDIEFSKRFKRHVGRPYCLKHYLLTSSRRWEQHGIIKTVLLMWRLRLAYFFGAEPDKLKALYRDN